MVGHMAGSSKDKHLSNQGGSSREKVLLAATDEFAEYGFEGGRVDRIAKRAGINKAMIYYHYDSKSGLYEAVIGSFLERVADNLRRQVNETSGFEELLYGLAETYARMLEGAAKFRAIMLRELAGGGGPMLQRIGDTMAETGLPAKLAQQLQSGHGNGELRAVDIRQAVFSFISLNISYMLLSPVANRALGIDNQALFIEEREKAIVDLFLHGVKARQA